MLGGGGVVWLEPPIAILATKHIKRCYNWVAICKKICNPATVGWYIPKLTVVGCKIILLYFILLWAHSLFPIFFSLSQPPFLSLHPVLFSPFSVSTYWWRDWHGAVDIGICGGAVEVVGHGDCWICGWFCWVGLWWWWWLCCCCDGWVYCEVVFRWWWCEFKGFDGRGLWDVWVWWVLLWFFVVGIVASGDCFWFVADFLLGDVWVWWWCRWWWWGWVRCGRGGYGLGQIWGLWAFGSDLGGLDQIWWRLGGWVLVEVLCGFAGERDWKIERKEKWKSRERNWIFYITCCWYGLYYFNKLYEKIETGIFGKL